MNIQPILLLAFFACFILGHRAAAKTIMVCFSLNFCWRCLVYFIYSAAKIAIKFHDGCHLRLVVLYLCAFVCMVRRRSNNNGKVLDREEQVTPHKVCFISPEYWPLSGGTGAYVYYLSNRTAQKRLQNLRRHRLKPSPRHPSQPSTRRVLSKNSQNTHRQILHACSRQQPQTPKRPKHGKCGHYPSPTASDTQLCCAAQLWKSTRLHRSLHMERRG